MGEPMTEREVEPKSVLLVDETLDDETGEHCDALMDVAASTDRAELFVTFPSDATELVGFANLGMGRQPDRQGVVTVGERVGATGGDPDLTEPLVEDAVADATDLEAIGGTVSRFCRAWYDQGYAIGVCIDGLEDLLAANDRERVFQFLHALAGRLDAVDATVHVHADPDAVDQRTLLTFEQAFDETTHEEVELDQFIPTGASHASDGDVADAIDDGGSRRRDEEASDDDIADALPD